jgi:hypothetical protein
MNKTLLLIIIDFLFLNLIALTHWEKIEVTRPQAPVGPEVAAQPAETPTDRDQDLVAAMKQSFQNEQAARERLAQRLSSTEAALAGRNQTLTQLQSDKTRLAGELSITQQNAEALSRQAAAAAKDAGLTKEQLARLQRELEEKRTEAERQKQSLAELQRQQDAARQKIEGLSVAVKVAEQEKSLLRASADALQTQVAAEREQRVKAQETATQLAHGVGQLAEKSGELTKEIRDNRPISANVLFSDFLANRVTAKFTAVRDRLIGHATRESEARTILVSDGGKIYALLHVSDTPFRFSEDSYDWDKIAIEFERPPDYRSPAPALEFLTLDPRVVAVPVNSAQAAALGVKVYPIAAEPFKFPEALLVSGGGKGYGEVGFKLDASQPGYVRVDNRLFKRLFGDFAPSRGDLVLSKTGELLGIMVNNDYCALVTKVRPLHTLAAGDDVSEENTAGVLNALDARVRALPLKLQ